MGRVADTTCTGDAASRGWGVGSVAKPLGENLNLGLTECGDTDRLSVEIASTRRGEHTDVLKTSKIHSRKKVGKRLQNVVLAPDLPNPFAFGPVTSLPQGPFTLQLVLSRLESRTLQ
jgi:hypothetical protein